MHCPNCENRISTHVIFCPHCGKIIHHAKQTSPSQPTHVDDQIDRPKRQHHKKLWTFLIVILICGAWMGLKIRSQSVHHLTPIEHFSRELPNTTWKFNYQSPLQQYDNQGKFNFCDHDTFHESDQDHSVVNGNYHVHGNLLELNHVGSIIILRYHQSQDNKYQFYYLGTKGQYLPKKERKLIIVTLTKD